MKARAPTADAMMAADFLHFLLTIFEAVPLTNANSESRFASIHTRGLSNHGNAIDGCTLAADHVLMEAKMVHDVQMTSRPHDQSRRGCVEL